MKNQIIIREAISEADTAAFWEQLHSYHKRDIFPDPEDENLKHFLSDTEYRVQIEHVHNRQDHSRCHDLFPVHHSTCQPGRTDHPATDPSR